MNKTASVVIIGGGISGCAIAYTLAKKGVKDIVVIERDYLSSGATGRCGAGVRMQWGTEMNCKLAKYSIEFFERANEELDYEYDIEFKQGGYLIVASTEKEVNQFKKNIALQNSLGIPSRLLTPKEAKEIVPHMDETKIIAATFNPKDGHLNPFHTTQAYANAAVRLGVEIMKYTTVTGINVENGKVVGVQTDKGYISTPVVVNAAGGYSQLIAKMVGIDLPVYSERHQILVTEPVAPMQGPMFMSFSLNIYCQQTPHGSFIMGRGDANEPRDLRITSSWHFMEEMAKTCTELLPPLKELRVVRQWSGLYNISPDRQPIYGPVKEVEGFYLACGFSGHGFMFGPVTGVVIAESILGETPTIPVHMLDKDRFERGELLLEPSVV
ncbi:MAG TPA: FAD-binding oxidoreductase [Bacillota bacterium]|nr:FAD-binding oxidoreductase [Bacillota bacterium]HQI15671.1 FAD-binding oxidoreductase [Bacillota bacterium]HQJ37095.1 FAD-binding oxidoreductase [Bacillota bacterium]HQL35409.1 FAD-binding oxidoreductase [Bacillota bacterium]HRS21334.1 FAD-binding oxidoreductase [Clostridia bacterium]